MSTIADCATISYHEEITEMTAYAVSHQVFAENKRTGKPIGKVCETMSILRGEIYRQEQ
jgi:hypothetical protein